MVTISTTEWTAESTGAVASLAVSAVPTGVIARPAPEGSVAETRVRYPEGVARIRGKQWLPLVVAPMFDHNRIGVSVPGREVPLRT